MGTSSGYGGPKGKNPLLPDDFGDNQDSTKQKLKNDDGNAKGAAWKNAKTQASKLVQNRGRSLRSAISSHVRASGGASKAASSARSGKATTVRLGGFLGSVSAQGIRSTLKQYKIEYEGRSTEEVLSDLINKIAPDPNTKEDSIARNAVLDTIEELYEKISENGDDLEIFDNLNEETFNEVMQTYISSYIFQRFLNDLEIRFEMFSKGTESTLELEEEIKEYISGSVEEKLMDKNFAEMDFSSNAIMKTINKLYNDCYEVIEGVL